MIFLDKRIEPILLSGDWMACDLELFGEIEGKGVGQQ